MNFLELYESEPEFQQEIINKFNIDLSALNFLGAGMNGRVWGIDNKSVLKVTTSPTEEKTVLNLIDKELTVELGYTTILPNDYLIFDPTYFVYRREFDPAYFVYRRENLVPFKNVSIEEKKEAEIIWNIRSIDFAAKNMYSAFVGKKAKSEWAAEAFLKEMSRRGLFQDSLYAALILFIYEAAIQRIFLWDIYPQNLGFRFNEQNEPAMDAGLVFFDPMARIYLEELI